VLKLLKKYSFSAIEIAPTMVWKEPTQESSDAIIGYKKFWKKEGIEIVSIQSVLFGHPELTIFENVEKRKKTLAYMEKMLKISALLGATDIIFGSPRNRDIGKLAKDKAYEIANEFFYHVGEIAQKNGVYFCIEPIPQVYETNFVNNTAEGILLVKTVNHPHFRLHLDSGALTINHEEYTQSIEKAYPYLQHFHISERNLVPIGSGDADHKSIAKILKQKRFDKWLSIEMRRKERGLNTKIIDNTLKFVSQIYLQEIKSSIPIVTS